MTMRLVLGCGPVGHDVVDDLLEWGGDMRVLVASDSAATSLREEGVAAEQADPTDPATYPEGVETVFVAGDDPATNLTAARRAREHYPAAVVVAYAGANPDLATVAELREVADRVIDPVATVASEVIDATEDETGHRVRGLRQVLATLDGELAVVAHDNPDPDAIAGALGLVDIAGAAGVSATACYHGEISHQENRALVNLLDISLRQLAVGEIHEFDHVALVDHSRPGVNDSVPEDTPIDLVVDHHPPRGPVAARFVDIASEVGGTSTLIAEYYRRFGLDPSERVATALLYGLRVDTADFTREVHERDYDAAAFLLGHADTDVLERVEQPSLSGETLDVLGRAIRNRDVRGTALTTHVGQLTDRDALAQAAERLLDMDGIHTVVVYGIVGDTVYVSARARGSDLDLGEVLRETLGPIGSAGGHANMAGAQIPLGILGEVSPESRETLSTVVETVIAERLYETLTAAPSVPETDGPITVALGERIGPGARTQSVPRESARVAATDEEGETSTKDAGETDGAGETDDAGKTDDGEDTADDEPTTSSTDGE